MKPLQSSQLYVGLMCGTSADGIDTALVDWQNEQSPKLIATHSHPLPAPLRETLLNLNNNSNITLRKLAQLDTDIACVHADAVKVLLVQHRLSHTQIQSIGFHGQTIDHAPQPPIFNSTQIGNGQLLAVKTGIPVIADVRRADIALGGQGAPLAPALHAALFRRQDQDIAVVNIGGIANISLLPANPSAPVLGFDTGPGNCLMDEWSKQHLSQPYDKNGAFSKSGQVIQPLLGQWMRDEYFHRAIPKSTGRDLFNSAWLETSLKGQSYRPEDVQATLSALTATAIRLELKTHMPTAEKLCVCGGGVHNGHLMETLSTLMPQLLVRSTADSGIDPDWVEAMLMSWLARQHHLGKVGNLPSVTGAAKPVRLGVRFDP